MKLLFIFNLWKQTWFNYLEINAFVISHVSKCILHYLASDVVQTGLW